MNEQDRCTHYVCTRDEAWQLVKNRTRFWVSNCGCREKRGKCARSRMDLCVDFQKQSSSGGSGTKEVTLAEVKEIFHEAEEKHLVTRPFRNSEDMLKTDGICFCCDDCCGYFVDPTEKCGKGRFIENTHTDKCTNCGECVELCYFNAREIVDGELIIKRDNCFGCGLCTDVCPEQCIETVFRFEIHS